MNGQRMEHAPATSAQPAAPPVRPELDAVSKAPTRAASAAARTLVRADAARLPLRMLVFLMLLLPELVLEVLKPLAARPLRQRQASAPEAVREESAQLS
jgi:hypothetical protein